MSFPLNHPRPMSFPLNRSRTMSFPLNHFRMMSFLLNHFLRMMNFQLNIPFVLSLQDLFFKDIRIAYICAFFHGGTLLITHFEVKLHTPGYI
jgi:hypothetical protein